MQLVEKHDITVQNEMYREADLIAYRSKNLYNSTLYVMRQHFISSNIFISYASMCWLFSQDEQFDYRQLPSKVAQQTMKLCEQNFRAFFKSIKDWSKNPDKYLGKPEIPKYLHKDKGRYVSVWTQQAISKKKFKQTGHLYLSGTNLKINTCIKDWNSIQQVRLVPQTGKYVLEVVYNVPDVMLKELNGIAAGCDLGVDNLITLTFNIPGVAPIIIDGKRLKSINQYYNKRISEEQEKLAKKHKDKKHISKLIQDLYRKRENSVNDYLHKASRMAVNQLKAFNVTEFFIGHNSEWKQDTNIGKKNTQNFMYIPFNNLIQMLTYKCGMEGITAKEVDESYTSKASFLDLDEIPTYQKPKEGEEKPKYKFSGYRKHRGLYKRKRIKGDEAYINADVNGSYNIMRKSKPAAFANGLVGVVVRPVRYCICEPKSRRRNTQLH